MWTVVETRLEWRVDGEGTSREAWSDPREGGREEERRSESGQPSRTIPPLFPLLPPIRHQNKVASTRIIPLVLTDYKLEAKSGCGWMEEAV